MLEKSPKKPYNGNQGENSKLQSISKSSKKSIKYNGDEVEKLKLQSMKKNLKTSMNSKSLSKKSMKNKKSVNSKSSKIKDGHDHSNLSDGIAEMDLRERGDEIDIESVSVSSDDFERNDAQRERERNSSVNIYDDIMHYNRKRGYSEDLNVNDDSEDGNANADKVDHKKKKNSHWRTQ
eukprot:GDKK01034372.1.p1 GENE.GDKK01034372.1~~GDKK01034372.1.p1  ORF type:complete len:178 (-),score=31.68 GDKK01034372.1:228-761(-)